MLFQRIMSTFGTNVVAAYGVGSMLLNFSFMPGVGFAVAASTLVGQHLGARDPDRAAREGWRSMFGRSAPYPGSASSWLSSRGRSPTRSGDPEVIELSVLVLDLAFAHPLVAISSPRRRAARAGDTVFPLICVFSGLVVVKLGVAVALVVFLDAPIEWVWSVLLLDYALKTVLFVERFRRGSWKRRRV